MDKLNISSTNFAISTSNNFRHFTCPSGQEFQDFTPPMILSHNQTPVACGSNKVQDFYSLPLHQKPVKKRSKWIKIDHNDYGDRSSGGVTKPKNKYKKKPDPNAPKITDPCSVCGRRFWSWKALFGHMRCHPERQWRGIHPPSNFRRVITDPNLPATRTTHRRFKMSVKDHEAAGGLLMLAKSPDALDSPTITTVCDVTDTKMGVKSPPVDNDVCASDGVLGCFAGTSSKKLFRSCQALGGHRASRRNIKGSYLNVKNNDEKYVRAEDVREEESLKVGEARGDSISRHQCSICTRVFPTGQALGGHKRSHWDKGDKPLAFARALVPVPAKEGRCWDLNLPAPLDDGSSCSSSSGLALELRLGI